MSAFEQKRCQAMAEEIAAKTFINEELPNALCQVSREIFSPLKTHACSLSVLPSANSQWISSPSTVAKVTMALQCKDVDSVLGVDCRSGYQAMILSHVIRRVFTVERIERLAESATNTFRGLGFLNINVRLDDGQNGWRNYAPYDRISFSVYATSTPKVLLDQLSDRGILATLILHNGRQSVTRISKNGINLQKEILEECLFVPVVDGKEQL